MKWYHYIIIGALLPLSIWAAYKFGYKQGRSEPIIAKVDTCTIYKEIIKYKPKEAARIKTDTIRIADTLIVRDTVTRTIAIQAEQREFRDSDYVAWVSGIRPHLDSIKIRQRWTTITEQVAVPQVKRQRVTFSVQGGFGGQYGLVHRQWDCGPYIGVGVSVNLF